VEREVGDWLSYNAEVKNACISVFFWRVPS
jgi:hypothetical protein